MSRAASAIRLTWNCWWIMFWNGVLLELITMTTYLVVFLKKLLRNYFEACNESAQFFCLLMQLWIDWWFELLNSLWPLSLLLHSLITPEIRFIINSLFAGLTRMIQEFSPMKQRFSWLASLSLLRLLASVHRQHFEALRMLKCIPRSPSNLKAQSLVVICR